METITLAKELIHAGSTERKGFTHAQIHFLGLKPASKWLRKAIEMNTKDVT